MKTRQQTFFDYDGFVDKFTPKKTTDDCYTPPNVYEAVKDWAVKEYGLEGREIVRPFWPGADLSAAEYPAGCVVIDNPPFSIMSRIVKWYNAAGIDYFLFSPYLTNFTTQGCNHIIAPVTVMFENGAEIAISFQTNMGDDFISSRPDLMDAIKAADAKNRKKVKKEVPKYSYPDAVITSTAIGWLCTHHTPFAVKKEDCLLIRKLDAMGDRGLFGGGYLLSERAAAERAAAKRAAAERAAAERAAVFKWELSDREKAMQKMISRIDDEAARAGSGDKSRNGEVEAVRNV
jgi:hypothetical protein